MNAQTQPAAGIVRDRLGRIFDALKFRRGADGLPRFDVLGRFVNLRGGRKKKNVMQNIESNAPAPSAPVSSPGGDSEKISGGAVGSISGAGNPAPATTADAAPAVTAAPPPDFSDVRRELGNFRPGESEPEKTPEEISAEIAQLGDNASAETIIGIIQTVLVLIGEEEGILTASEKILLRRPLDRVLKKYEIGSETLPCELDLAICCAGLLAARLQKPKTATFFLKCKAWVIEKFFAAKGEKLAEKMRDKVGPVFNQEGQP